MPDDQTIIGCVDCLKPLHEEDIVWYHTYSHAAQKFAKVPLCRACYEKRKPGRVPIMVKHLKEVRP